MVSEVAREEPETVQSLRDLIYDTGRSVWEDVSVSCELNQYDQVDPIVFIESRDQYGFPVELDGPAAREYGYVPSFRGPVSEAFQFALRLVREEVERLQGLVDKYSSEGGGDDV